MKNDHTITYAIKVCLGLVILAITVGNGFAQNVTLTFSSPFQNEQNVSTSSSILLEFSNSIDVSTLSNNIFIIGNQSGHISGTTSEVSSNTIKFDPAVDFIPGEIITVSLANGIKGLGGEAFLPATLQFSIESHEGSKSFPIEGYVINQNTNSGAFIYAVDLDGDKDIDIINGIAESGIISWIENNGNRHFTEHQIGSGSANSLSVFATDMDGDGDIDVLTSSWTYGNIKWLENDGNENFVEHEISNSTKGVQSIFAIDLDADRDIDVLSASGLDDKIEWHENDGSQSFTPHTISDHANNAISVYASDLDGDNDLDVLSVSYSGNTLAWYENDGFTIFDEHIVASNILSPVSVFTADMDSDGDLDILSSSGVNGNISWYQNDGNKSFIEIPIVKDGLGEYIVVKAADIDGDKDVDIVAAGKHILWYENDGNQSFSRQEIDSPGKISVSIVAADMDGDGDLDIVSGLGETGKISLYEQATKMEAQILGISDKVIKSYNLYPNPAKDKIYIKGNMTDPEVQQIELFNLLGEKQNISVKNNTYGIELNIEHLVSGLYIIRFNSKNKAGHLSFIKR